MKTTNNFENFTTIVENYINGNYAEYIYLLNKLNKYNVIRFTLFLKFQLYRFEVYAENNLLKLRDINN